MRDSGLHYLTIWRSTREYVRVSGISHNGAGTTADDLV